MLFLAWQIIMGGVPNVAGQGRSIRVGVIVSMNIRPYFEALDGIKTVFSQAGDSELITYFLDDFVGVSEQTIAEKLTKESLTAVIAVGPEAIRLVWSRSPPVAGYRAYTMALYPEKNVEIPGKDLCGVSLQVPFSDQVRAFCQVLPGIKRIGLLYDPAENQEAAVAMAEVKGIVPELVPLAVTNRENLPGVLQRNWSRIDGLWFIPDRTVITESLVPYIIKEAIANDVAVLGFNRLFYESGAVMAFILDYEAMGGQTARMIRRMMAGTPCVSEPPLYRVWFNTRVADALNIREINPTVPGVEAGP